MITRYDGQAVSDQEKCASAVDVLEAKVRDLTAKSLSYAIAYTYRPGDQNPDPGTGGQPAGNAPAGSCAFIKPLRSPSFYDPVVRQCVYS